MNLEEFRAYQERKSAKKCEDEMTKMRVSRFIRKDALTRSFATLVGTIVKSEREDVTYWTEAN